MRNIFVGDKDVLGFECRVNNLSQVEGRIFMYVNGVKYGQQDFDEDLIGLLDRLLAAEQLLHNDYKDLFNLSSKEFRNFMMCLWGEIDDSLCEKFKSYKFDLNKLDSELIIRAGYAFDQHLIALVPCGDRERLIVIRNSEEDGESTILKKGEFFKLLRDLYAHIVGI